MKRIMTIPVFSSNSVPRFIWDAVIIAAIVYSAITIPISLLFIDVTFNELFTFDFIVVTLFIIDIFIHFNSSYYDSYHEIFDRKKIAKNYLKTWFIIDFLSVFPFEYIYLYLFSDNGIDPATLKQFRMLRVLRLLRLSQVLRFTYTFIKHDFIDPGYVRLFSFGLIAFLVSHFVSCFWIYLEGIDTSNAPINQYVDAIYWTVTTLTTVGYGDITASTIEQKLYTIFVMLLGVAFYAYVIGNIATILSNINFAKATFINKVDSISAFLKYNQVPKSLQNKIKAYYQYVWSNKLVLNESDLLSDLPESYQRELTLFLNKTLIQKVPIFKTASKELIHELFNKLKLVMYGPNDNVFTKGQLSKGMYFINNGSITIHDPDNQEREIVTFTDGNFFGEMSLVLEASHNYNARVNTFSELHRLSRDDFQKVIKKHPDFAKQVELIIKERKKK
jgi:voltage-gated potassium channel Kch